MKNKMKQVIVHLNQLQLEKSIANLQENVNRYIDYTKAVENITGKKEFKTLAEIEQIIKDKSGFSNVMLSAGLLECLDAFKFIESNSSTINIEVLEFDNDGTPTTKKEVIDQVKEDCTTYLSSDLVNDFETLSKACEQLNKLSNPSLSHHLNKAYDGKYSVNLLTLHNSNRI